MGRENGNRTAGENGWGMEKSYRGEHIGIALDPNILHVWISNKIFNKSKNFISSLTKVSEMRINSTKEGQPLSENCGSLLQSPSRVSSKRYFCVGLRQR